jgi:hypothetical protein
MVPPLPPTSSSQWHPGHPAGLAGHALHGLIPGWTVPSDDFWRAVVFPPAKRTTECHYRVLPGQVIRSLTVHPSAVRCCGSTGNFSATIASRFQFLGIRTARFNFALDAAGFSVPFGLLLMGTTITAGLRGLLPRWLVVVGLVLMYLGFAILAMIR